MQRSILTAVDLEIRTPSSKRRSEAVCRAASFLSQRLKTGVDLLYVEDMKTYRHDQWDPAGVRSWRLEHQANLKLLSRQFGTAVSRIIKRGSPAEQILKASGSAELVVLGTHGRKGLRRLLVGSVAEEVIRHARRPVMVIGPLAQERGLDPGIGKELRILVATDLGRNSRAAERYALSLGRRMGARVVLFHCLWDSIDAILVRSAYVGIAAYRIDRIMAETRDRAVGILKQKARFFREHEVRCDYNVQGEAVLSRCGVSEEGEGGYAMIIMGTRGRNALLSSFFGSTARETILNAMVPVITVRSG